MSMLEKLSAVIAQSYASHHIINIVLVGRTGNGKSATGNSIVDQRVFLSKRQIGGITTECKKLRVTAPDGPIINVIDTPGLSGPDDFRSKEIIKCLDMAKEGIHAVLFVLSAKDRISPEDESTFIALHTIFKKNIFDYFIVVFTGGDVLEEEGLTLDEYLGTGCSTSLTNILRLCGGRKVLFDNMTSDKDKKAAQLKQLLAHVADVRRQTGGKPFTSDLHYKTQEEKEKSRDQEREIEFKLAKVEAEVATMKVKSGMKHEQIMKMVQEMEENEKLREKEKDIESKKLAKVEVEVATIKEKMQMEHEQTMKMVKKMEENEKLREKEREIESKRLAKAEAETIIAKEKSRMEHEKIMDMVQKMEQNEKLREKERDIESKKLAKAELEIARMKTQMEHQKIMKIGQKMVNLFR